MALLIIIVLVVAGLVAYRFRVPLLAKILGQPESRIRYRLERRKR
jgi:hypothetical protein